MAELSRLPGTMVEAWEWQVRGACRAADPWLFFHPDRERGPAKARREAAALRVCASCPVIRQCRDHALSVREPYGIWGGTTQEQRDVAYGRSRSLRREAQAARTAQTMPSPGPSLENRCP